MSKLQEIKAANLSSRKERDFFTSSLLSTVIEEAEMICKNNGNRESTDEEVLKVLKKFEKNLIDIIEIFKSKSQHIDTYDHYIAELEIIRKFLPMKLSDLDVQKISEH